MTRADRFSYVCNPLLIANGPEEGVRTRNGNLSTLRSSLSSWNGVRMHVKRMLTSNTKQRVSGRRFPRKTSCGRFLESFLLIG
jgi:hypothetical protein